jgi:hypothetical protein
MDRGSAGFFVPKDRIDTTKLKISGSNRDMMADRIEKMTAPTKYPRWPL